MVVVSLLTRTICRFDDTRPPSSCPPRRVHIPILLQHDHLPLARRPLAKINSSLPLQPHVRHHIGLQTQNPIRMQLPMSGELLPLPPQVPIVTDVDFRVEHRFHGRTQVEPARASALCEKIRPRGGAGICGECGSYGRPYSMMLSTASVLWMSQLIHMMGRSCVFRMCKRQST